MRAVVLVVLALVAVAFAQTPKKPNLNDSFTGNVAFEMTYGQYNMSIYGTWFVDFVGRQHAFHTGGDRFGPMQIFIFYNTSKQYEFFSQHNVCNEQMGQKMFFFGTFDFVLKAAYTGQCMDRHGNQGYVWTATVADRPGTQLILELCAAPSGNIPYMVSAIGQFNFQSFSRTIEFFGYYPGAPAPSVFTLPSVCAS